MYLRVDPSSSTPLYAQVVEQIRSLVLTGALRPGDRLPAVRELAVRQRINRNTAAKAYGVLEGEGVIETRRGRGTFVAEEPSRNARGEHLRRVRRFVERITTEAAGLGLSPADLRTEIERAEAERSNDSSSSAKGA